MHNKKTILTAALLGMALLLSACSKMTQGDGVGGSLSDSSLQSQTMTQGDVVGGSLSDSSTFFPYGEVFYDGRMIMGGLEEPEERLDPAEIYANVTYTPQMFYGDYRLNHKNDGIQTAYASREFLNSCKWVKGDQISDSLSGKIISSIPYRIVAGNAELDNALITDTNYNWCQIYFAV